ncbi:MAG: hypothetical protein E6H06_06010 [Bacteroidetes bacterium]|nr:MAG: hypothetical protein E6H06_06010 [Bacteroidota bacterium]
MIMLPAFVFYGIVRWISYADALVSIPIRDDKCLDSDQSVGTFIVGTCMFCSHGINDRPLLIGNNSPAGDGEGG